MGTKYKCPEYHSHSLLAARYATLDLVLTWKYLVRVYGLTSKHQRSTSETATVAIKGFATS